MSSSLLRLFVLGLALAPTAAITQCGAPPPCNDVPSSMMGYFDGVLFDEDLVGQTYAYVQELCLNVDDQVLYYTSTDEIQTYVMLEDLEGYEVYVILVANFKETWMWDGGVEILVFYDAAAQSARTGEPIALDGVDAIGYYWEQGFWNSIVMPQYQTSGGEIMFDMVSRVPGGFVEADYTATMAPAEPPEPVKRLDGILDLGPIGVRP